MNLPQKLGRYEIERRLGAGAMGEVYLARDPQIERLLALKTLKLEGTSEADGRMLEERLLFEAKAAGQLVHPNVVTLFDTGKDEGVVFLAFEYVEGCHLGERATREPKLRLREVLRIVREVSSALDAAQARGIVHRDIKPSNILLDEDGTAKVADFGIAKMRDRASDLTVTGAIIGTPHYMSPEQIRADPLDGRSDVFSLGAVLYELLHRERPFRGETITTLVYQILHHDPLGQLRADLPSGLKELLHGMLEKDFESRLWASEVVAAIDGMFSALSTSLLDAPINVGLPEEAETSATDRASAVPPPPPVVPSASSGRQPSQTAAPLPATTPLSSEASPTGVSTDGAVSSGSLPAAAAASQVSPASSPGRRTAWLVGGCIGLSGLALLTAIFFVSGPLSRLLQGEAVVADAALEENSQSLENADPAPATSDSETGSADEGGVAGGTSDNPRDDLDGDVDDGALEAGRLADEPSPSARASNEVAGDPSTRSPARTPIRSPGDSATPRSERPARSSTPPASNTERPATTQPPATQPSPETRPNETPSGVANDSAEPPPPAQQTEEEEPSAEPIALPTPVPPDETLTTGTRLSFQVRPEDAYILFRRPTERRFVQIGQAKDHDPRKRRTRPWDLPGAGTFEMILRAPGHRDYLLILEASSGGATTIEATLDRGQPGGASPP